MNLLVRPLPGQAELAPCSNVLLRSARGGRVPVRAFPSTTSLSTKDSVELVHCKASDRIVLIHEKDCRRSIPFPQVESSRCVDHFLRIIAPHRLKRLQVGVPGIMSHHIDVCRVCCQSRKSCRPHQVVESRQRVLLQEAVFPQMNQMLRQFSPMNPNDPMQTVGVSVVVIRWEERYAFGINSGQLRRSWNHRSSGHFQSTRRLLRYGDLSSSISGEHSTHQHCDSAPAQTSL